MKSVDLNKLIAFVVENAHRESSLLYPQPSWYVFTEDLFNFLVELTGLSQDEMSRLVDSIGEPDDL